ncbi:hypothetical protein AS4_05790 [Acinetobacter guillouiae]|nr:hypothetical protein AS4_05790 [Acinetobacter guillouiae]
MLYFKINSYTQKIEFVKLIKILILMVIFKCDKVRFIGLDESVISLVKTLKNKISALVEYVG